MPRNTVLVFVFAFLLVASAIHFERSSSESCEEDESSSSGSSSGSGGGHHHHHHPNGGCAKGWKRFNRPDGGWCMTVLPSTGVTYANAANACVKRNAVLSGVQNPAEMTWIHQYATKHMKSKTGSLWIGLRRTASCLQSKLTAICSKLTSFYWTDGSASGSQGFSWLDGSQPDNALGGNQNCVLMFFAPRNTTVKNYNWYPGALDDVSCDTTGINSPRQVQGYVCGMRALR